MVGLGGLEPPTSPLSGARSSHLSYRPQHRGGTTHNSLIVRWFSVFRNCGKSLVVGYFESSSRNLGSIQIFSPELPVTDSMWISAMPTSLKPATINSRPTHFKKVDFVGKSG